MSKNLWVFRQVSGALAARNEFALAGGILFALFLKTFSKIRIYLTFSRPFGVPIKSGCQKSPFLTPEEAARKRAASSFMGLKKVSGKHIIVVSDKWRVLFGDCLKRITGKEGTAIMPFCLLSKKINRNRSMFYEYKGDCALTGEVAYNQIQDLPIGFIIC
ncbi:hypothetical protein SDC9_96061 [bioreactor metagenome]|uniref:Uncharacterized protein n=1 Tax=bioreactor metagenome TaxID=1076179 RepID=A0A645A893_9ZZZZ